jgi:general secretion pathway protein H
VLALVPGFLVRSQPGLDLDVAARAIADGLRQTRSESVFSNRARAFTIDVEAKRFKAGTDQAPKQLDRAIQLSLFTADQEVVDGRTGRIRFFPDGSSTGGRLRLALAGRQTDVLVDWLTGEVAIADVAPE